jgi:hypothetical protein
LGEELPLKAEVIDRLVDEFAPPASSVSEGEDYLLGRPGLEVDKFFVAWSAAQLEGIVRKPRKGGGAYVAYLGSLNERLRFLFSLGLKGYDDFVVRFINPAWRYHSWGVASRLARDLGVEEARPVLVLGRERSYKVVTFVPSRDLPRVRESLFAVGGGRYGLYSKCSFSTPGKGTFYGEKGSDPAYGEAGRLEEVDEQRLEVLVPSDRIGKAISSLRKAHPYEEPVIETYEVGSRNEFGEGRAGVLRKPMGAAEAARRIASTLGSQPVYLSRESQCSKVMIWDGDADRGIYEALVRDVDLYVGADSSGLAKLVGDGMQAGIIEFPQDCFLMAGAKELVYLVRDKSKRETWGLRTFLPSKVGREVGREGANA